MTEFHIVIDSREQRLLSELNKLTSSEEIRSKSLHVGDIAITDAQENIIIVMERKTLADLKASIFDGRYKEQKNRLLTNFKNRQILFIIEGDHQFGTLDNILISTFIHSIFRDHVQMLFTKDCRDTAILVREIHKRVCKNPEYFTEDQQEFRCVSDICLKKHKCDTDIQKNILSQIPGISGTIAKGLIDEFGTVKCIVQSISESTERIDSLKINGRKISKTAIANLIKHLN